MSINQNQNLKEYCNPKTDVSPGTLTRQQVDYLETILKRKTKIEEVLDDKSPLMIHFSYELDPFTALDRNRTLEIKLAEYAQSSDDSKELLNRFKRVVEKCPNSSTIALVPFIGFSGINTRIKACSVANEKLLQELKKIETDNLSLKTYSASLNTQVEAIGKTHTQFTHRWLRIIKLIEDSSISTGIFEYNSQNKQNIEYLSKTIDIKLKWSEWQQSLKVLKSQLNAILQAYHTSGFHVPQIDESNTNSYYMLLNLEAEAISNLSADTIKIENNVRNLESILSRDGKLIPSKHS